MTPTSTPSNGPALTPATVVKKQGRYIVAVQGIQVGDVEAKSKAVTLLCQQAIARSVTIVATFFEGSGKHYLSITQRGEVTRAAAPAPGTIKPDYSAPQPPGDLGVSSSTADSTREWVEETLLVGAPEPTRRKRLFRH